MREPKYSSARNHLFALPWLSVGGLLFFTFVMRDGNLLFGSNEVARLALARQKVDPGYLPFDWTHSGGDSTSQVFDSLMSLFFVALPALKATLLARATCWLFFLASLFHLASTLRFSPIAVGLGTLIWYGSGQALIAEGWIVGGVEPKSFAYPLAFFGLSFLLQERFRLSAFCLALAFGFHPFAGGWSLLCAAPAAYFQTNRNPKRWFLQFALPQFFFALPFACMYGVQALQDFGFEQIERVDYLYAIIRGPHHTDPFVFLNWQRGTLFGGTTLLFSLFVWNHCKARNRDALLSFGLGAVFIFLLGIAARYFEIYGFLKFYPFRIAPVLLFLLTSILSVSILLSKDRVLKKLLSSLALGYILFFSSKGFPVLVEATLERKAKWEEERETWQERKVLSHWIAENTSPDDTFIFPPSTYLWFYVNRGHVVEWKRPLPDSRLIEWYERLIFLNNRKEFKGIGYDLLAEVYQSHPKLTKETLREGREKYGVKYYVTETPRGDLQPYLSANVKKWFIYNLETL